MTNPKITTAERLRGAMGGPGVYPRENLTVVLAHGCWDIVHPGHIRHLRAAKDAGDLLVVSVTSDGYVNKGPGRPYFPVELRADQVAALEMVDHVVITDASNAAGLIRVLRPNVYAKGAEYEGPRADMHLEAERRAVAAVGGRILYTPGDVVFSSTELGRLVGSR